MSGGPGSPLSWLEALRWRLNAATAGVNLRLFGKRSGNPNWRFAGLSYGEKRLVIRGVNVWAHKWVYLHGDPISVTGPAHGERLTLSECTLSAGARTVRFAYTEVSYGVYVFYVPT